MKMFGSAFRCPLHGKRKEVKKAKKNKEDKHEDSKERNEKVWTAGETVHFD